MNSLFHALVIDEDYEVRSSFRRILSRLGCLVDEIDSTTASIESVMCTTYYSVVFAALCSRHIGARDIARWLRTNRPSTKLFVVTGWRGELERSILLLEGIHGVIHKPILFTEVRDALIEHLG